MLILWCGSDADSIKKVIGPVIQKHNVAHQVVKVGSSFPDAGKDDVVLAFGSKALAVLQALKVVPKNRTIGSLREVPITVGFAKCFVTYDPGIVFRDYARLPEIQWDVALSIRLHNTGHTAPKIGKYRWVEDFNDVIEAIDRKFEETGKPVDVACDLETLGLDEYDPEAWIISISFTVEEGKSDLMYFKKGQTLKPVDPPWEDVGVWEQVNWILTSDRVSIRGANFKFDSRWLNKKWGINCTNQKFDTVLVGSLLDENRSNSLKLHAKIYTDMGGYEDGMDKHDFARMDLVPKPELLEYAGGDTDVTLRIASSMKKELLQDKLLTNFYVRLVQPAAKAFESLERTGVCVDLPYYRELQNELENEVFRLESEMMRMVPVKIKVKYEDDLKITRPALLKEFLFTSPHGLQLKPKMLTEKTQEPSTSLDHLMMFMDNPDAANFISHFQEYGSTKKTLSTYVVGFLKHLRSDGRFHPTYMLHRGGYGGGDDDSGTVTGRCLTAEALILTDKGEISIKEVVERGEQGEAFKVLTHKNRWLPVTGFWRNGLKPVCTVKAQGRSLTSTYNHPYMSFPSWTLAEDLKLGAWLYSVVEPPKVEEWRPIVGWPFEVSNMGGVRRAIDGHGVKAGDIYKQQAKGKWGHLKVTLRTFGEGAKKQDFPVHKLVADAFLTNKGGVEIAHLNGDAACNWSTNLKWVSVEENKLHFRLHGTANREAQKKLTWDDVDAIRSGYWPDSSSAAEALGVSRELVRDVRLWKKWNGRRDSMAGFAPIRVDSVIDSGTQETFDLTVEEDHSFVANGLVVHNTSAKDPAVQTIPKHTRWTAKLRRAFIAPPGYAILNTDYSQGELKIAACLADEPTMIDAFLKGADLHKMTAMKLNNVSEAQFQAMDKAKQKEFRSGGKAGNFGLLYGMGANGYREYARNSYNVILTEKQAAAQREAFFDLYSQLPVWHSTYKGAAHKFGYVRSPLGRIRHLPLINAKDNEVRAQAERQAVNSPVQSCLSDMMQLAMVAIDREFGNEDIHMFLMTHDSVSLYCREDEVEMWAKRITELMGNLPIKKEFYWDHQLPFTADAEISIEVDGVHSLANMKEL